MSAREFDDLREVVKTGLRRCRHEDAPARLIRPADEHHVAHMVALVLVEHGVTLAADREPDGLRAAVEALAERLESADLHACPACGHDQGGEHNSLGCYGTVDYGQRTQRRCDCVMTDMEDPCGKNAARIVRGALLATHPATDQPEAIVCTCPPLGPTSQHCPICGTTDRGEVGTGAGEGAPRQDTGSAWVTRSTDCPEAPAQAHLPATDQPEVTP